MNANKWYYTVYLAKTDEIVAFGTSSECAKMMNMSINTFYSTCAHSKTGRNQKYEVFQEPLYHTIRKDDVQTMRNPNRIDKFCDELKVVWKKVPDWRFGQLMCNVLGEYQAVTGRDPFFPEEDEMLNFLRKFVKLPPLNVADDDEEDEEYDEDDGEDDEDDEDEDLSQDMNTAQNIRSVFYSREDEVNT